MKITIHQPDFLPWPGFFIRWHNSDFLIIYDDAQFIKGGWQNRDKILIGANEYWLTVPILVKNKLGQLIKDVQINYNVNWQIKHIKTLHNNYNKSKNFSEIIFIIEQAYSKKDKYLIDLNLNLLEDFGKYLNINTPIKFSSDYKLKSVRNNKLIDMLKIERAKTYISGTGSKAYLDEELFKNNDIKLVYQNHSDLKKYIENNNFHFSIIHYLFNNQIKSFKEE
tara:strand:+ start:799 stop:1467 length:669 start_codon:yes stop_codon:yes gene_type:complete